MCGNLVKCIPHRFQIIFPFFSLSLHNNHHDFTAISSTVKLCGGYLWAKRKHQVNECHTATLRTTNATASAVWAQKKKEEKKCRITHKETTSFKHVTVHIENPNTIKWCVGIKQCWEKTILAHNINSMAYRDTSTLLLSIFEMLFLQLIIRGNDLFLLHPLKGNATGNFMSMSESLKTWVSATFAFQHKWFECTRIWVAIWDKKKKYIKNARH